MLGTLLPGLGAVLASPFCWGEGVTDTPHTLSPPPAGGHGAGRLAWMLWGWWGPGGAEPTLTLWDGGGSGGSSLESYWAGKSQKTSAAIVQKLSALNLELSLPPDWVSSRERSRKYHFIIIFNAEKPAEKTLNWQGLDLGMGLSRGQARPGCRGLPQRWGASTGCCLFRQGCVGDKGPGLVRLTHAAGSS